MKIAIQGHPTRGKEVIQILKSLGGENTHNLYGNGKDNVHYYHINSCGRIALSSKYDLCNYKFYTLEEFEKEFPFKIGDIVTFKKNDKYPHTIKSISIWTDGNIVCEFEDTGLHYPLSLLKYYKEMKEERNVTLTLDKAKEWYKKDGELREIALQAFSEKELNPLPRSWEEYCRKHKSVCLSTRYANIPLKYDALIKLEQLRNYWWNGWEPEWNNCEKYVIKWDNDDLIVFTARNIRAFLVFPTREMAHEFLNCFRSLIEQAGDLI